MRKRKTRVRSRRPSALAALTIATATALFAFAEPSAIVDTRIWRDLLSYCVIAMGAASYWILLVRAKLESY